MYVGCAQLWVGGWGDKRGEGGGGRGGGVHLFVMCLCAERSERSQGGRVQGGAERLGLLKLENVVNGIILVCLSCTALIGVMMRSLLSLTTNEPVAARLELVHTSCPSAAIRVQKLTPNSHAQRVWGKPAQSTFDKPNFEHPQWVGKEEVAAEKEVSRNCMIGGAC